MAMSVAYENRLTIPQLDNAINVTKAKLSSLGDENDPRIQEKLKIMLEKFQKAKAKINRYYEKTVKKNPSIVIKRNQLRVIDTLKNPAAEARKNVKNPSNAYNALDAIEDKRGFLIAGVATAGTLGVLSTAEITLSAEVAKTLGLSSTNPTSLLKVVGAFLQQNPAIVVALGTTAAIVILAKMPKIRAAWNKSKVNKAALLDAENEIYDKANELNPEQQLLANIIKNKNNLKAIPNFAQELADHPALVTKISAILANPNDNSLDLSVKDSLLKFMHDNGLGSGLPKRNAYSPTKAILKNKLAGLELNIAENEASAYKEAKDIMDHNMASADYKHVVAINGSTDKVKDLYEILNDPSKCPATTTYTSPEGVSVSYANPAYLKLKAVADKVEAAVQSTRTTALSANATIGTDTKSITDHFTSNNIDALITSGSVSADAKADAQTLKDIKTSLDRGVDFNLSSFTIKASISGTEKTSLENYIKVLTEYRAQLTSAGHFTAAENAANTAARDSLGITGYEKAEQAALNAVQSKLGITDPAKRQAKLDEIVKTIESATMGA